jgi:peptide-methionine (S)-S-oxide reductase
MAHATGYMGVRVPIWSDGLKLSSRTALASAALLLVGARPQTETAVFAGGCFWGVEAVFEHVKGVRDVVSGYAGGSAADANYKAVSRQRTGHAEAVRISFDPRVIGYSELLRIYFTVAHDPTQLNRQGPDVGTQYRSAVFYRSDAQRQATQRYIAKLGAAGVWPDSIVTQVSALGVFHPAEAYHQDYLVRHPTQPYIVIHDLPKLEELKRRYPSLYRELS